MRLKQWSASYIRVPPQAGTKKLLDRRSTGQEASININIFASPYQSLGTGLKVRVAANGPDNLLTRQIIARVLAERKALLAYRDPLCSRG